MALPHLRRVGHHQLRLRVNMCPHVSSVGVKPGTQQTVKCLFGTCCIASGPVARSLLRSTPLLLHPCHSCLTLHATAMSGMNQVTAAPRAWRVPTSARCLYRLRTEWVQLPVPGFSAGWVQQTAQHIHMHSPVSHINLTSGDRSLLGTNQNLEAGVRPWAQPARCTVATLVGVK